MAIQGIAASDFKGLSELKNQAQLDSKKALPEVAKQFEAIFLQSMLKSMRSSQHFVDESSPFRGKNPETFQEMLDTQYVSEMTQSTNMGFAKMLIKQLDPTSMAKSKMPTTALPAMNAPIASTDTHKTEKTASNASNTSVDDFVKALWDKAKQAASTLGLDPKLLMAQAALETGWGKFIAQDSDGSSSNNLFNVKTGNNKDFDSVTIKTTEYIADTPIKVSSNFRKYGSIEESFNDYVSLIQGNERYKNALANAGNAELYVSELGKAGYATDPNYSSKILSIYHGEELNQAIKNYEQ